jgi:hypothetical protein
MKIPGGSWSAPSPRLAFAVSYEQFDAKGHLDVIGAATGRKYRIQYGTSMNVYELDDAGRLKMGWCFVPQGCLVAGDVMLAQKIALETFESRVLLVAKRYVPFGRLRG